MAFTEEQNAALDAQGRVIVSASAGSGKTTVMIEKIIRLIRDGVDVSEILAMTFTKKAAAQMKEKLCKALIENVNAEDATPEKRNRLKRQLSEVPSADISTIHSFCAKLIRSHFYAAGVDSGFRVIGSDDAEGVALKNEALDELLEEEYEQEERDEDFAHLLSVYWRKKSDNALRDIFSDVYETLRMRADYKEYLDRSSAYDEKVFDAVCKDLHRYFVEKCEYYLDIVQDEKYYFETVGAEPQIKLTTGLCEWLEALRATRDYFEIAKVGIPKLDPNSACKKDPTMKEHHARLTALKKLIVDTYENETKTLLSREEELDKFLRSGQTAAALAKYLKVFDQKYEKKKRERGVLDYNDLEHIALELLSKDEIVRELNGKYRYVFVDEYQDVNPVQEMIISKLGGQNLFLVGDVKQSIYGFRGSKSKYFVEKQAAFAAGEGKNLAMTRNFRSADKVLEAVNSQFTCAMTPQVSGVNYARDSVMGRGGRYEEGSGRVQIHVLGKEEKAEKKERGVYSVRENAGKKETGLSKSVKTVMQIIQDERASKWFDPDEQKWRQVRYSDIAILVRKNQKETARLVAALSEKFPVTSTATVNVCDYGEVKTLIDILSLIDNAKQDIPLCSALLSAMGNLTADDLAQIRLSYRQEKFFRDACARYAQEKEDVLSEKLRKFYGYYEKVRNQARVLSAGEILTTILAETRMEAELLSRENGTACLRRIRRFIEETNDPEPLSTHEFLARLRDLEYEIKYNENGGEDSVKVLTMHSSKGLEYPVVILDNLSDTFHGVDRDEVFVEEKYGLAPRAFDDGKMLKSPTVLRRLYSVKDAVGSVADELNLYYVALTRAKYSLHMIFKERGVMPNVKYARSYADMTDFSIWQRYVVEGEGVFDPEKQERTALVFRPDETLVQRIMTAFLHKYPYGGYENLLVKSSASKLLSLREEGNFAQTADADVGFGKRAKEVADGATEAERIARNELGTAYHAFLEYFDFSLLYDGQGNAVTDVVLRENVERAFAEFSGRNAAQAALLKVGKLTEILSNPVFYTLKDMRLYKEQDFLAKLSARETYALAGVELPDLPEGVEEDGDGVIYQGAIDLLAVGEEVRIVDYKYSTGDREYLKSRYKPQLALYRMAAAKILGIDKEKIRCTIVNIDRGFEVDMD